MSEDQAGWTNADDQEIDIEAIGKAICPVLWRVLVCPVQPRKMSKGAHGVAIALVEDTQENEAHMNYIGRVVAMGPLAGRNDRFENPEWRDLKDSEALRSRIPRYLYNVKIGDWIAYGRYAGQRQEWRGIKLLAVNDDEVIEVIEDPADFRVYA